MRERSVCRCRWQGWSLKLLKGHQKVVFDQVSWWCRNEYRGQQGANGEERGETGKCWSLLWLEQIREGFGYCRQLAEWRLRSVNCGHHAHSQSHSHDTMLE